MRSSLAPRWRRFDQSIYEALALTRWYAQEHVLLCLVPAFFIAGAIAVFVLYLSGLPLGATMLFDRSSGAALATVVRHGMAG